MTVTNHTDSGQAHLNNHFLGYETTGTGQPFVFIHAGIADRRMWQTQVEPFANHFQVITYDLRGFGQSPVANGRYAHYQDLADLLDHLGIEKAILVGCSKGGAVAIDFALAYPGRVKALVLVGAAVHGLRFETNPLPQESALEAAEEAGDLPRVSELEVQIWIDGGRKSEQVDPAVRQLVYEMNLIALQNDAQGTGEEEGLEPAAAHRLAEITVPTLLLIGDLDVPASFRRYEWFSHHIPHARRAIISGAAHLPNMEKPAEFNRLVLNFLQQ